MFISTLELFKIGIGPSSSHTMGPMVAAGKFRELIQSFIANEPDPSGYTLQCILKGSLALTGRGHATDRAILFGVHGYLPDVLAQLDIEEIYNKIRKRNAIDLQVQFNASTDIIFDTRETLALHPNGMIFNLLDKNNNCCLSETYFSIGGGFVNTVPEMSELHAPLKMHSSATHPYPFASATDMLQSAAKSGLSIAAMKRQNEQAEITSTQICDGLDRIWFAMQTCVERGLASEGVLPGGLLVYRRARNLITQIRHAPQDSDCNDYLCAYAMAVNEENAMGHMVVTAPTNGAAGVIPAVLYYAVHHQHADVDAVRDFLLTAAAVGGIIKHRSSISGSEVGCQGEIGSAAAMAAAGLCAIKGGTPKQVENAAEIALEHHLGLTCDPVKGLVQIPCIERNAFGAIKAYTAASLAIRGSGEHVMPLDACISAMKQTGIEMSSKFKETSLGGLAVSLTEC